MPENTNVTIAPLIIQNLPDLACFKSFKELLEALPTYLVAQIPNSITNVVIGNTQPTDSQRNYLWVRKDNSGSFVGLYVFGAGLWNQIYPIPNQLFRIYRLSTDPVAPPKGFIRADNSANITADIKSFLITQWFPDPSSPGEYLVYDAVYVGF